MVPESQLWPREPLCVTNHVLNYSPTNIIYGRTPTKREGNHQTREITAFLPSSTSPLAYLSLSHHHAQSQAHFQPLRLAHWRVQLCGAAYPPWYNCGCGNHTRIPPGGCQFSSLRQPSYSRNRVGLRWRGCRCGGSGGSGGSDAVAVEVVEGMSLRWIGSAGDTVAVDVECSLSRGLCILSRLYVVLSCNG
jgi:hypothetical protein